MGARCTERRRSREISAHPYYYHVDARPGTLHAIKKGTKVPIRMRVGRRRSSKSSDPGPNTPARPKMMLLRPHRVPCTHHERDPATSGSNKEGSRVLVVYFCFPHSDKHCCNFRLAHYIPTQPSNSILSYCWTVRPMHIEINVPHVCLTVSFGRLPSPTTQTKVPRYQCWHLSLCI